MANIKIEPSKARATLDRQQTLERDLRALAQDVENVRSGLRYKISGREAINARLREAVGQINKESESARVLRLGLEQIINRYEQTEKGNFERIQAWKLNALIQPGGIINDLEETDESTPESQFIALLKSLLSWADKTKTSDTAGIAKDGISYLESLYKFFSGDKRGLTGAEDWFDLGDKSIGLWTEFYDYLKDFYNGYGRTFSMKNQKSVAGFDIAGGFLGLTSSAFGIADQISNTEDIGPAGITGEIISGGDNVVDIWGGVEKLRHIGDTATNITTKNKIYSPLTFYSSIAKGYISAFSQGFKSYEKYIADGSWDWGDTGRTGVEFGVSGLYSMVDTLSFGLLEPITGVSAEDISSFLENWAADVGKRGGNYIRDNSTLHTMYDYAGPLGKLTLIFYSASKS